ncbi:CDP-glucose 4,6-dehydratase [Achromobacter sp. F4_2707]|uniref:CDP-glucose 4,6-dehydratase n=1 Tax=Achromobacter sp. F4_2707 TaxID=3114286 RepID=UPI0039C73597
MVNTATTLPGFWQGKRVLLTGHTGFKGSWLALWLARLGAHVTGLALPPDTAPNLYTLARLDEQTESHFCDIRNAEDTAAIIRQAQPEIVFHLAAQALVRAGYADPLGTYASNVMGTAHVLDALRGLDSVRVAVIVTTDKVYRPKENTYPYRETDTLGGYDPYSASKAASEIVIDSYRQAFLSKQDIAIASARAGNVIGGGDWSADRLIPDAVRAWQANTPLQIRQPESIRPWQHVLEPLHGYLCLAQQLWEGTANAHAYNLGPLPHEAATVRQVITLARAAYGKGETYWGNDNNGMPEAGWLALETALARQTLGVTPRWTLEAAVTRTLDWYRKQQEGHDAVALCLEDLAAYIGKL